MKCLCFLSKTKDCCLCVCKFRVWFWFGTSFRSTRIRELQFELNWGSCLLSFNGGLCVEAMFWKPVTWPDLYLNLVCCRSGTLVGHCASLCPRYSDPPLTCRQTQWPLSGRFNNKCQSLRRNVSLYIASVENANTVFDWKSHGMRTFWRPVSSG
jgi:hypothetical protein